MFSHNSQIQFPWVGKPGRRTLCISPQLLFSCDLVLSFHPVMLGFGSVQGSFSWSWVHSCPTCFRTSEVRCTHCKVCIDHCLCISIFTSETDLLLPWVLLKAENIDLMAPYIFGFVEVKFWKLDWRLIMLCSSAPWCHTIVLVLHFRLLRSGVSCVH